MLKRIELTNFMAHEHTVLEPAPGLTLLIGPNNCGKSAVVAALQVLTNNADSTYVVRHGAKECSIVVETDDGQRIEWRRKQSPSYDINGEKFDRLGKGGVPDELAPALRIRKVRDTGDDIHFGEQKSPLFLIDKPAAHVARFFSASSDVSHLVAMQNRHREKHNEAKRTKVRLEAESARLAQELETLAPMVPLDRELDRLEAAYRELGKQANDLAAAARVTAELRALAELHARHAAVAETLSPLAPPPVLAPTAPLELLLANLTRELRNEARDAARSTALAPLAAPPAMGDTAALAEQIAQLRTADRLAEECRQRRAALLPLAAPPALADTATLARLVADLAGATRIQQQAETTLARLANLLPAPALADAASLAGTIAALAASERQLAAWNRRLESLASLAAAPAVSDGAPLAELLRQYAAQAAELERQEAALAAVQQQRAAAEEALRAWAREQQTCPTCGAALDPSRLVAGACPAGREGEHG